MIISCKNEVQKEIPKSTTEKKKSEIVKRDTFKVDFQCKEISNSNLKSEIKVQLAKLEKLENNYQVLENGKSNFEESIIFNGLKRLEDFSDERQFFQIDNFKENINQINYANIKGTKDLGSKFYARAKIEELIFKSDECANKLVEFVNRIKEKSHTWEDVDKSPSSIFKKENKVYYISSGGWYMKPFYKEIENEMKK